MHQRKDVCMRAAFCLTVTLAILLALVPGFAQTSANNEQRGRDFDLVSVNNGGDQGNNDSDLAAISADARFVAFASIADNLVPNDNNFSSDVFVHDRKDDTTERVSVSSLGAEGDANSGFLDLLGRPDISADGRYVAFASEASNFVLGDTPFTADVFVHDRRTHRTELITRGTNGLPAGGSMAPSISADAQDRAHHQRHEWTA